MECSSNARLIAHDIAHAFEEGPNSPPDRLHDDGLTAWALLTLHTHMPAGLCVVVSPSERQLRAGLLAELHQPGTEVRSCRTWKASSRCAARTPS
jgi:hypothetical protein